MRHRRQKFLPASSFTAAAEAGATMVEMALVFGLFVTTVLFFLDCSRYFLTKALLIRGAQEAADLASRIPDFDLDTTTVTSTSADATKFNAARTSIVQTGLSNNVFSNLIAPSTGSGWVTLQAFSLNDKYSDIEVTGQASDVLILRPGDSHKQAWDNKLVHHPDRCSAQHLDSICATLPTPPDQIQARLTTDTMQSLMRTYPIVVRMRATVNTLIPGLPKLIPFMGPWTVQATAVRWREQSARSGFRDAGFTDFPPFNQLVAPGTGPGTPPPACQTTTLGACTGLGLCARFCTSSNCCFCQACGGN